MLEVETKYRCPDPDAVTQALARLGAVCQGSGEDVDRFFAHPGRDFAATDEVLRLRSTPAGQFLTYKGPKRGGPGKAREELETPLARHAESETLATTLIRLGFTERAVVRKNRTSYSLSRAGRDLQVLIDRFPPVGTFCEVEALAGEHDFEAARIAVADLARELGLSREEPRSYLAMHLELQTQPAPGAS